MRSQPLVAVHPRTSVLVRAFWICPHGNLSVYMQKRKVLTVVAILNEHVVSRKEPTRVTCLGMVF